VTALTNPKHERFSQELAKGKTAEEAHRVAGYKASRSGASQLKHQVNISNRVAELLAEREVVHAQATADAIKSTALTKEWVIETLKENVARAMQAKPAKTDDEGEAVGEYQYQGSVANRALELLGKELGMFIDRKEVGRPGDFENMNADQLREYIRREAEELGLGATPIAQPNGSGKPH
jgi:phage terminase small subunit